MARPSNYRPYIADEICNRIANGESLVSICRDGEMPNAATVYEWLKKQPEFADRYARARETQADVLADEIVAIADDYSPDRDVQRDKLRIDARKWYASKLKPKVYGDRQQIDANVDASLQVQIVRYGDGTDPQ